MVKIFIDPGHGGSDPGSVGNGLKEKDLTLSIATRIKDILLIEYTNVFVKMSRTSDTFPSLSDRTNQANAWEPTSTLPSISMLAAALDMRIISIRQRAARRKRIKIPFIQRS